VLIYQKGLNKHHKHQETQTSMIDAWVI